MQAKNSESSPFAGHDWLQAGLQRESEHFQSAQGVEMSSNQKSIIVKVEKPETEMAGFHQIHMAQNQGAMEGAPHLIPQDAKMSNDKGLLQSGQANQVIIKKERPGSYVFPSVQDVVENAPVTNMNQLGAHQMLRQIRPVSPPPGFELSAHNMNRFSHVSTQLTEARWRNMPHENTRLSYNQLNAKPSYPATSYPFRGLANMSLNTSSRPYNRQFNMIPLRYMNNQQKMPERREFNYLMRPNLINTHQSAAFNYQAGISGGQDAYYNNLLYSGMPPAMYKNQLIPAQAVTAGNVASAYYPPQGAAHETDNLPPLLYYDLGQFHGAGRRRRSVAPKPSTANPRNKMKSIAAGGEDQVVPQVSYPHIQDMDQMTREFLETLCSMGRTATASSSQLYRRRVNPPLYRRRRGSRFADPILRSFDNYICCLEKAAQNNHNVGNNCGNMQN